ncbi:MAG: EF-hand domain-containing protein, partial [Alphaproteobacteria bacterium]|nr:EF-hand domain-containing protein [Alphaproteobacteria bacterium]
SRVRRGANLLASGARPAPDERGCLEQSLVRSDADKLLYNSEIAWKSDMTEDAKPPNPAPKSKKSETLEVRLPFTTKRAFLDACREDGTTASEVVRGSIHTYLAGRARLIPGQPNPQPETGRLLTMIPKTMRNTRYLAGAAGAVGLAVLVAMPSAAGPDIKGAFERLDIDKNGVLSAEEFGGPFDRASHVVVIDKRVSPSADGAAAGVAAVTPGVSEKAVTFWLGDGGEPGTADGKRVVVERRETRIVKDGAAGHGDPREIAAGFHKSEFDRFDADGDGKVSYAEYEGRQRQQLTAGFDMLDADKNRFLTAAEYAKISAPVVMVVADTDGKELTEDMKPMMSAETVTAQFVKLDKNGDGRLSLEEYLPQG